MHRELEIITHATAQSRVQPKLPLTIIEHIGRAMGTARTGINRPTEQPTQKYQDKRFHWPTSSTARTGA
jgi:hypothetical protein